MTHLTTTTDARNQADELAERILTGSMTLADLADIADGSLEAQNVFARVRIIAERQIAQQYLFDADDHTQASARETLKARGWDSYRIKNAERYTQLGLLELNDYIQISTDSHKEATAAEARALTPVSEKPERKTLAASYTAPPIDVQIAREFGIEASDERADMLVNSVNKALSNMSNPKHAYVWAKYHGINDDGTIGDRWTFQGIAATMGQTAVTREYVESLYYRALSQVNGQIAVDALNELRTMAA